MYHIYGAISEGHLGRRLNPWYFDTYPSYINRALPPIPRDLPPGASLDGRQRQAQGEGSSAMEDDPGIENLLTIDDSKLILPQRAINRRIQLQKLLQRY